MTAIAAQTITAASGADAGPQWVNDLMDGLGAPGAGVAIALENLFPPIPSEVILPLAGFAASNGRMGLIAVLLWTTAGSVIGALALYGVGALLGRERTLALAGRLPLVKVADVEKTEAWFLRHGTKAVFFGRMIPLFRSFVSVPAGVERMPLPQFLGLTTLGSAIWNTAFVLAGYALGDNWTQVTSIVSAYSKVVLAAAALALLAFVVIRLFRSGGGSRRAGKGSADSGSRDAESDARAEAYARAGAGETGTTGAPAGQAGPARYSATETMGLRRRD
ncbi:DedA family protein [Streptomyces thermocarboxydus]|uniref:DedA family protein n=1 Tax=Streptomyces TaxID=1883 RepID=UPI0025C81A5A|nr:DedA family protein [Streptomyces thermocarboxydus]